MRDCPPGQPKPVDKEYRPEKAGSTVVFQVQENDSTRFEDGGGFKRIYKGSTTVKQQEQSYELYEARQHEMGDRGSLTYTYVGCGWLALLMQFAEVWVSKVRWNWWEGTRRYIIVQYPEHVFVVVAGREEASTAAKETDGGGEGESEGSGGNQPKAPRSMIQQGLLN